MIHINHRLASYHGYVDDAHFDFEHCQNYEACKRCDFLRLFFFLEGLLPIIHTNKASNAISPNNTAIAIVVPSCCPLFLISVAIRSGWLEDWLADCP